MHFEWLEIKYLPTNGPPTRESYFHVMLDSLFRLCRHYGRQIKIQNPNSKQRTRNFVTSTNVMYSKKSPSHIQSGLR